MMKTSVTYQLPDHKIAAGMMQSEFHNYLFLATIQKPKNNEKKLKLALSLRSQSDEIRVSLNNIEDKGL